MKLSKATLLSFRRAVLAMLAALDTALLEGYGWTPRGRKADIDAVCYTEMQTTEQAR